MKYVSIFEVYKTQNASPDYSDAIRPRTIQKYNLVYNTDTNRWEVKQ